MTILAFALALATQPTATSADPKAGAHVAPKSASHVLRMAVYDFENAGVDVQQHRIVMLAVVAELRKLNGASVIGMDEVHAMLAHEADKQLLGCSKSDCLAEIADALGVDVLIIGTVARTADNSSFGMKRLSQREAKVTAAFDKSFGRGDGEEYLASIGPAVAQLFPELPLKPGGMRGVSKELAWRLHPPPVPLWMWATAAATTGGLLAVTAGSAVLNAQALEESAHYKRSPGVVVATATAMDDEVDQLASLTWGVGLTAAGLGVTTAVAAAFTNFGGPSADDVDAGAP